MLAAIRYRPEKLCINELSANNERKPTTRHAVIEPTKSKSIGRFLMSSQLSDHIPDLHVTRFNDFGVDSPEAELLSDRRIYDSQSCGTKASTELTTSVVGLFGDFNDAFANT
jgi:hypothetical protein